MLPISNVIYAKRTNNTSEIIEWILFEVYKVAPTFPLDISIFANVLKSNAVQANEYEQRWLWAWQRVNVTEKFQSKSTRDDLKGLKLTCGLAVNFENKLEKNGNVHLKYSFSDGIS